MQAPARPADRCAACGAAFHCGVADTQPCWCTAFTVDRARLAALVAANAGCLCPACLAKVTVQPGKTPSAPPHA